MAIRFYDEAIYNKIQKWIKDPNMVILKPNETSRLLQLTDDQRDDKPLTLPLIALSRDPNVAIQIKGKRNLTYDGVKLKATEEKSSQLNAIPMSISYQLDIFTRFDDEGDEYLRNFVFNFINYPKMKVVIPYNGANIEHVCYIQLSETLTDNSDISERLFPDQFTRWTLNIDIQDAYFYSVSVNPNAKIVDGELQLIESSRDSEVYLEEKVNINSNYEEDDFLEVDLTGTKE